MAVAFLQERWLPKSVLCLRDYNVNKFSHDLLAGVTVGLVALPLAMAFAIASGLTPQAGIYCAIVTGLLISLFGGSKTQIGGPTGAFVVVVAGIVAAHGVDGLFMELHDDPPKALSDGANALQLSLLPALLEQLAEIRKCLKRI